MKFIIGRRTIIIYTNALQVLSRFAQHQPHQPEAGGIIMGKFFGEEIHVLRLSTPTELDKATRNTFERHRLSAQIVVDYEFYNSGGQMAYLGEWHTHPEKHPNPSGVDRQMIRQQFRQSQGDREFLLFFIQGTESLYVAIYENNQLHRGIAEENTL